MGTKISCISTKALTRRDHFTAMICPSLKGGGMEVGTFLRPVDAGV
jgi:hypothetical protein